jgi:shikimate kinase
MVQTPIILVGPMGAGKSTIAALLAERLKLERAELDELRWEYFKEMDYDREAARKLHEQGDLFGLVAFMKPLEVQSIVRVVSEHQNCVIDFGASNSVFDDEALLTTVKNALAPIQNVILLMPSPDPDESMQILNARIPNEVPPENRAKFIELNEYFSRHSTNYTLAKITVYSKGQTAEQTCDEIMGMLK